MHSPLPRNGAPLIELRNVTKVYQTGETEVRALDGVSLTIRRGEFIAIMGQSGSGKSTLMNILGCLDRPSGGRYEVAGTNVAALTSDDLAALMAELEGRLDDADEGDHKGGGGDPYAGLAHLDDPRLPHPARSLAEDMSWFLATDDYLDDDAADGERF